MKRTLKMCQVGRPIWPDHEYHHHCLFPVNQNKKRTVFREEGMLTLFGYFSQPFQVLVAFFWMSFHFFFRVVVNCHSNLFTVTCKCGPDIFAPIEPLKWLFKSITRFGSKQIITQVTFQSYFQSFAHTGL